MSSRTVRYVLLAVVLLAIILSLGMIIAGPNTVSGSVVGIERGESISNGTVRIVNCSDNSILSSSDFSGDALSVPWNAGWTNYMVNFTGMGDYIDRSFKNGSVCFSNEYDSVFYIYPVNTTSINVTVIDEISGRPIPGAYVNLTRTNVDVEADQGNNFRCDNGVCRTDSSGNMILIVKSCGTFNLSVNASEYVNYSQILPTITLGGEIYYGDDYQKSFTMRAATVISGYLLDEYNAERISSATVSLMLHEWNSSAEHSGEYLGYDGVYNYTATSNGDGSYAIYVPASLISSEYDLMLEHEDYIKTYKYEGSKGAGGGYGGGYTNLNLTMKGLLPVNGTVLDCFNDYGVSGVEIFIQNTLTDSNYTTITDSDGDFSLYLRNSIGGYDDYNITLDKSSYNIGQMSNLSVYINTCISGSFIVNGTVEDKYKTTVSGRAISGGLVFVDVAGTIQDYNITSDGSGYFSINIPKGVSYDLRVSKTGFITRNYYSESAASGNYKDYDVVNLTGSNSISGTVVDHSGEYRTSGTQIEDTVIEIYQFSGAGSVLYTTVSDANGAYSVSVPSDLDYLIRFSALNYNPVSYQILADNDPSPSISLYGTTFYEGYVLDTNMDSDKVITPGTMMEFFEGDTKVYSIDMSSRKFEMYMGISDFNVTLSHQGYITNTVEDESSGGNWSKNYTLSGRAYLSFNAFDNFSSGNLSGAVMRLFDGSGNIIYKTVGTDEYGDEVFNVDSTRSYSLSAVRAGYQPRFFTGGSAVSSSSYYNCSTEAPNCTMFNDTSVVTTNTDDQSYADIFVDYNDNKWVVWQDNRGGNWNIYYTRLDVDGSVVIAQKALTTVTSHQTKPRVFGSGNYIWVFWEDDRASKKDIYASMMHRNGTVIRSNVAVVNTTYSQSEPYAVVDAESGSMWLYWVDDSLGDYNLYTKNLLFNMSSLTSPVSIASVDALGISTYSVTEDVLGNSWIFYVDNATGSDDLYYLKYDENHTLIVSGEKLSDNSSEKIYPSVSSDGSGDIWVTWADNREDVLFDIYFSKVYQNRSISIYDTQVVGNPSSQQLSSVEISGERTYITWVDGRSGSDNIYLSVLDNGGSVYNSGEILTHSVSGDNILPRSTVTSDGVVYVLFYGDAAGNKDVYLSNISIICSDPVENAVCFDKDITLSAVFEVNVRDPAASGEYQNVWNALVQVYHNYNETLRPVSISPTIVNVDVTCGGSTYAGINVSALNNDNALEFVTQSDGVAVVSGIPIGLYNITVNGSEIGCGAATIEINIRDAGLNHSLSFSVSQTNLYVQALDPLGQPIYPANVSYQNSDLVVESMTPDAGQFAYYDTNVPNGVYNVYVNNSPYYNQNDTTCTVSLEGGSNMCVVYLEPNPGNLSVHVLNATGDMANINITVDNSSIPAYSGETNGTGWYLFSDLAGLFNVTVDGEQYGFENGTSANLLVGPLGETVVEYTLDVTRLDIIVTNTTGQVLDTANVTLFVVGSGSTATNYTGDAMSEITGSDGTVSFVRLIAGVYNLSIDVTGYGHYINSSFKVEGGTNEFDLSMQKTAMNVTVIDTLGNVVSGVNVTVKDENGLTYYEGISGSDGEVMFNSTIYSIGYNITADGTLIGYNYTSMNETIVGGILNNITIVIEENRLNVTLYSEHDGLVLKNVAVSVNTTPSTVVYTDENGAAVFGLLDPGLYNVTVNSGVIAGVNYTDFEVSVSGITSSEVVMRENVLRICVINDLSEPVIDGVNVSVYSNESPFVLLDDSFGAPMRNVTSTSLFGAGNITYRQVPLNHSGGPVVNSTVNITVNGSLMGYGSNVSYMADLVRDYNEVYILINRTLLVVNVTDQAGNPVDSIINLYNLSDLNNPVINSTGDVMSCDSGASGLCTFTGLIPGQYNVTARNEKTVDHIDDFSVINIVEGSYNYLHLDPPMVLPFLLGTYYNGVVGDDVVFTFNVTYGGSVVENVTVGLYMPEQEYAGTYLYTSELSDSGGLAVFTLTPGVYDVKVDGSQEGYGIVRIDSLKIGKLLVSQGYTDNQGDVVLPIDGRSISGTSSNGFNVNVFAYGYQEYDTYGIISGDLVGSYYSHGVYDTAVYGSLPNLNNDAYSITLTGNMTFTGRISDAYAIIAQAYAKYLAADITIYSASENERYEFSSASDGYYSVDMSNYAWGATSSGSKVQPLMSVEKSGYVTDSGTLSVSYHDNPLVNVELVGNSSITGYVYGYNTTEPASQINVSFKDNLGNKVYSVLSDNNGSFNFYANPNYAPYTLHFRDATYYNLLAYETTPFVEYDSANNEDIYYMLMSDQGVVVFNITNSTGQSISSVDINMVFNGSVIDLATLQDGTAEVLIGSSPFLTGRYNISIDGSSIGYGVLDFDIYVDSDYSSIARALPSTRLNISINSSSGNLASSAGSVVVSVFDSDYSFEQVKVVDDNNTVLFERLPFDNYTVRISNNYYWYDDVVYEIDQSVSGIVNNLSLTLSEPRITFNMTDSSSGSGIENLTISLYNTSGDIAVDKKGNDVSGLSSASGELVFYDLIPANYYYEINGSDIGYGVYANRSISVGSGTQGSVNLSLSPMVILVTNVTYLGSDIVGLLNVSLRDSGGQVVSNVSGDSMNYSVENSTALSFAGIVYDSYSIWASADGKFDRHYDAVIEPVVYPDEPQYSYVVDMYNRTVEVRIYDIASSYDGELKDLLNSSTFTVSLLDGGGAVTNNLSSDVNIDTVSDGYAYFYGVDDGSYHISSAETSVYYKENQTVLDTYGFTGYEDLYLREKGYGYINMSTVGGSSVYVSCAVDYVNTVLDTKIADDDGMAMLKVNVTKCNSGITVRVSRSGYTPGDLDDINLTAGQVLDLNLTIYVYIAGGYVGPSSSSSSSSSGVVILPSDDNDTVIVPIVDDYVMYTPIDLWSSFELMMGDDELLENVVEFLVDMDYDVDSIVEDTKNVVGGFSVGKYSVSDVSVEQVINLYGGLADENIEKVMVVDTLPEGVEFDEVLFDYQEDGVSGVVDLGNGKVGYLIDVFDGRSVSIIYTFSDEIHKQEFMELAASPVIIALSGDVSSVVLPPVIDDTVPDDGEEDSHLQELLPYIILVLVLFAWGCVFVYNANCRKKRVVGRVIGVGGGNVTTVDPNLVNIRNAVNSAVSGISESVKKFGLPIEKRRYHRIHDYNKIVSDKGVKPVIVRPLDKERFISE